MKTCVQVYFYATNTNRADFEERARFLLLVLKDRGYNLGLLGRQFCRAVAKYISDFQKWELPLDTRDWFRTISE